MAISIRNLDHVVLRVADVERSIRFYGEVLGCREERRVESIGLVQLRAGQCMIDLIPTEDGTPGKGGHNMDHFCLRVDPFDAAGVLAHLDALGIEHGPLERRYGAEGQGPSIYIEDPDGNTVELKGPPE